MATTRADNFDVAFLGDSITQGWEGGGAAAWKRDFAPLRSANFGFSGDRTEHALWRLDNGEIIGSKVRLVVIMLGTNNVGHGSSNPQQTVDGMRLIISKLLAGTKAKVLLVGILPRGRDANDRLRIAAAAANEGYKRIADSKRVFFLDTGYPFVRSDGTLIASLMPDLLHLSEGGYEIWAKALLPDIKKLLTGR